MTVASGRALRISRGGVTVVGARTDSFTIENEPVDITDKDDAGWRTLLADAGSRSISAEVEGVLKDSTLIASAVGSGSALIAASVLTVGDIAVLSGNFFLSNITVGAEQDGAITFTATLTSGDDIGLVAAAIAPFDITLPTLSLASTGPTTFTSDQGTWGGSATVVLVTTWEANATGNTSQDHPGWAAVANEAAAIVRYDAGDSVRIKVTATNGVGSSVAYSAAIVA